MCLCRLFTLCLLMYLCVLLALVRSYENGDVILKEQLIQLANGIKPWCSLTRM